MPNAKAAISVGLTVYQLITVLGYFTTTAAHCFALAILVGVVRAAPRRSAARSSPA